MGRFVIAAVVVGVWLSSSVPARADRRLGGAIELSTGLAFPDGDTVYDDLIDHVGRVGLRAGLSLRLAPVADLPDVHWMVGLDVSVGMAWLALEDEDPGHPDITRQRVIVGGRVGIRSPRWWGYLGAGGGLDRISMDNQGIVAAFCGDAVTQGLGLDGYAGLVRRFRFWFVGAQFGASWADHRGDRPPCLPINGQPVVIDVLDYWAVEVDAGLITGATF